MSVVQARRSERGAVGGQMLIAVAVFGLFTLGIGASNRLGEFESGISAAWLGLVPSIVLGGLGTLLVVALWWRLFPELTAVRGAARPAHPA